MGRAYFLLNHCVDRCQQLSVHELLLLAGAITVGAWIILVISGRRFA